MMTISDPLRAFAEKLPSDWQLLPFEAMLTEPVRNGVYKTKEFHGSGVRVVNMGELFGFDFISEQEMKRVELTSEEVRKSGLNDGDLLFARRSLVLEGAGKCSLVVNPPEAITFESSIIRARPNRRITEPRFLFYLFTSPLGRAIVASIATRTAVSGIRGSDLMRVGLPLPPLRVQRRIASILSAYDELIENNQRRIRILENMARSLYREWFVHFRYPGHESVPLVESSFGQIPQGWEVRNLKDIAKVTYGCALKSQSFNADGNGLPVVRIRDIPTGASETYSAEECDVKYHINNGHILVGMDGDFHMCIWSNGLALQNQRVARFESQGEIGNYHLFLALERPIQEFNMAIVGTTVAHLGDMHIKTISIVWPPSALREKATKILEPLSGQVIALKCQTSNLRRTRDLLLQRLLAGDISLFERQ